MPKVEIELTRNEDGKVLIDRANFARLAASAFTMWCVSNDIDLSDGTKDFDKIADYSDKFSEYAAIVATILFDLNLDDADDNSKEPDGIA